MGKAPQTPMRRPGAGGKRRKSGRGKARRSEDGIVGHSAFDSDVHKALEGACYTLGTLTTRRCASASRASSTASSPRRKRRLPGQLLHRQGTGEQVGQPAAQPRDVQRRPLLRVRGRAPPDSPGRPRRSMRRNASPTTSTASLVPASATTSAATRKSNWRWSSSTAPPARSATSISAGSSSTSAATSTAPSASPSPRSSPAAIRRTCPAKRCGTGAAGNGACATAGCRTTSRVLEQTEAVGHAVRAGYMYAAMADIARFSEAPEYAEVLR